MVHRSKCFCRSISIGHHCTSNTVHFNLPNLSKNWSFVTTTILGVSFQSFKVFLLNFFHISELNFVRFSQTNHEKRSSTRIPSQKRAIPHKSSDRTHEMSVKFLQNSPESIIFNLENFKSLSHCCHLSVLLFSEYWRVKPNCYIFLLNSSTNLTVSVKKFLV